MAVSSIILTYSILGNMWSLLSVYVHMYTCASGLPEWFHVHVQGLMFIWPDYKTDL